MSPRRYVAAAVIATMVLGACSDSREAEDTLPPLPTNTTDGGSASSPDSVTSPPSSAGGATTTVAETTTPSTTAASTTEAPDATTTAAPAATTTPPTPPPTAPPTTRAPRNPDGGRGLMLDVEGIGPAKFGDDADDAIAAVQAQLGPPSDDSGWVDPFSIGACPGDRYRQVQWNDLLLDFSDVDGKRRFIGYAYGSIIGVDAQPPGLATDQGIGVGATVAELSATYPSADLVPGEEGLFDPRFTVPDGISGYLTGTDDNDFVTSIEAGDRCRG